MTWVILIAQLVGTGGIGYGPSLPSTCSSGDVFVTTTSPAMSICTAANTWASVGWTTSAVPSGAIMFIESGTCPAGFTQDTSLNGVMVRGTIAANSDVGTTGGADTITPTVASLTAAAQTFTGSSATTSAVSAGTPAGTNSATATSGNCAATNIAAGTGSTTACKATSPNLTVPAETFTGSALATHTHTLTATGTNGTSTVTGTLNSFDNRPAFIRLIACKKN